MPISPITANNMKVYEAVQSGRLTSMSFAFNVRLDEFIHKEKVLVRMIKEAQLIEISAVKRPTHRITSISVAMSDERKKLLLKTMTI